MYKKHIAIQKISKGLPSTKKQPQTDLKSSLKKKKKKKGLQPRFKEEKKEWADLICIVKLQ